VYGGSDDETLAGAVARYRTICDAVGVPASHRATCEYFSLRQTDQGVPDLLPNRAMRRSHSCGRFIPGVCALRVREEWQTTSLASTTAAPDDLAVARFTFMVSPHLAQGLSSRPLPDRRHATQKECIHETRGQCFTHDVVAARTDDPHAIIVHIKLLLTAGPPPEAAHTASPSPSTTPAFLTYTADDDSPWPYDTYIIEPSPSETPTSATSFYMFKRFCTEAAKS